MKEYYHSVEDTDEMVRKPVPAEGAKTDNERPSDGKGIAAAAAVCLKSGDEQREGEPAAAEYGRETPGKVGPREQVDAANEEGYRRSNDHTSKHAEEVEMAMWAVKWLVRNTSDADVRKDQARCRTKHEITELGRVNELNASWCTYLLGMTIHVLLCCAM